MEQLMESSDLPCVNLKKPVELRDIMNKGLTFEINYDGFKDEDKPFYDSKEVLDHVNFDCMDIVDEDNYDASSPFSTLTELMEDLLPDGGVKKRILRPGVGEVVPKDALVSIHYNAYLEYNEEPFDSTYVRKRVSRFQLGKGQMLEGLEIGLKSMKVQEKAQFLVVPRYAYGPTGCLSRIPPNSTVLFEVELASFVNSGAASNPTDEEQNDFEYIHKYALALCEKGNDLVKNYQNYKMGIRQYNMAATKLENCPTMDYKQQEKSHELLLRLYSNLAVCYLKHEMPRRCCLNCNKIYHMLKGTDMPVPAKVYYNNAKALIMLHDLKMAERRLRMAADRKRDDPDIVRLFLLLDGLKEKQVKQEEKLAKILVGQTTIGEDFKKYVVEFLQDFKDNKSVVESKLPPNLNKTELDFVKVHAVKLGFSITENDRGGRAYSVVKPNNNN